MKKNLYVLDTNVLLTDYEAIYRFGRHDVLIPLKVLEEVDKHKKRTDGVGANARQLNRTLDELRSKGNLFKGVRLDKGKGILKVRNSDPSLLPPDLAKTDADNLILACALGVKKEFPRSKVIVVTLDINLRVKCDAVELKSEDYVENQVVQFRTDLYSGFMTLLVDDQLIDQFYKKEEIFLDKTQGQFYPNQFVMLQSSSDPKKTALSRFINFNKPIVRANRRDYNIWGVSSWNNEQSFALDILLDPKIKLVTLTGSAGSGKTLLSVAAGLKQVLGMRTATKSSYEEERALYRKLVISRPVQPMGKDLGYLPGNLEEKMAPWLSPIYDNLEFVVGETVRIDKYFDKGIIEVEALSYIRGRSISNALIIVDEAQNLSKHEIKTIITRVGEGTKLVLTGDIEQIDNLYLDATSNGLSYAIEALKGYEETAHITLQKGERSRIATIAAKAL